MAAACEPRTYNNNLQQDLKEKGIHIPEIIEERRKSQDGSIVVQKYLCGKLLGKGGFARCYVGTPMDGNDKYALKIVPKCNITKPRAKQKLQSEIRIHRNMNHINIVRFDRCFEDSHNAYILLELCGNNSLSDLLKRRKRLAEPEARYYLKQLISSLQYLRQHLVIHRDLKLGNLFIDNKMQIKVGDFGLAAKLVDEFEKRRTVCGTPNYIAPEILAGKEGHSFEVDIWSTGVVLYTFLVGKPPFETKDVKSTYKRILECSYAFPDNSFVSESAKSLIRLMLQLRPDRRPSLEEILDHPFFTHSSSYMPPFLPETALREAPAFPYSSEMIIQHNKKNSISSAISASSTTKIASSNPLYSKFGDENDPTSNNRMRSNSGAMGVKPLGLSSSNAPVSSYHVDIVDSKKTTATEASKGLAIRENNIIQSNIEAVRKPVKRDQQDVISPRPSLSAPASRVGTSGSGNNNNNNRAVSSSSAQRFDVYSDRSISSTATTNTVTTARSNDSLGSSHGKKSSPMTSERPQSASRTYSSLSAEKKNYLTSSQHHNSSSNSGSGSGSGNSSSSHVYNTSTATNSQSNTGLSHKANRYSVSEEVEENGGSYLQRHLDGLDMKHKIQHQMEEIQNEIENIHVEEGRQVQDGRGMKKTPAWAWEEPKMEPTKEEKHEEGAYVSSKEPPAHLIRTPPENMIVPNIQGEINTLEAMHKMLDHSYINNHSPSNYAHNNYHHHHFFASNQEGDHYILDDLAQKVAKVWVVKHVDYTSKYGMGFLLNTGSAGVYFNDATKIILNSEGTIFQYIERRRKESSSSISSPEHVIQSHSIYSYPMELQKKVLLLKHFRNYLLEQQKMSSEGCETESDPTKALPIVQETGSTGANPSIPFGISSVAMNSFEEEELTYVKKWVRTRHAILFRLSNRTVQVVFFDRSEVILSAEARVVTFVNKQGQRSQFTLEEVMQEGRGDIAKRLRYTKDIMYRLINAKPQ